MMASPNFPPVYEQPAYSYGQPQTSIFWNGHSWQQLDWFQQHNTMQISDYFSPYYQQQQRAQQPYENFQTPQVLPRCSSILVPLTDTPSLPYQNSSPLSVPPQITTPSTTLQEMLRNSTPLPTTQNTASTPETFDCQPMNGYYPGEIFEPPVETRKRPKIQTPKPIDTDWIKKEIEDDEIMIIDGPSSKRIKTEIDSVPPATAQEPVSEFPSGDDAVFADVLAAAGLSPSDFDEIGTQAVEQQAAHNCFWQTEDIPPKIQTDRYPDKNSAGFCGKCRKEYPVSGSFRQHMRAHVGNLLIGFEKPHLAISQFMEALANTKNHQFLKERNPLCQLCARQSLPNVNFTGCLYMASKTVKVHLKKCHSPEDMDLCFPPWTPEQLDRFQLNFGPMQTENLAPIVAKKKPSLKSKITGDCRLLIRRQFSDQNREIPQDNQQCGENDGFMFPAQSDLDLLTRFETFLAEQTAGNEVRPDTDHSARSSESRCSSVSDRLVIDIPGEENVELDADTSCLQTEPINGEEDPDTGTVLPRFILSDLLPRENQVPFAYNDTQRTTTSSEESLQNLHMAPPSVTAAEEGAPPNLHTAAPSVTAAEEGAPPNLHTSAPSVTAAEEGAPQNLHTAAPSVTAAEEGAPQNLHRARPYATAPEEEPLLNLHTTPPSVAALEEEPLLNLHTTPPSVTAPEEEPLLNLHTTPPSVAALEKEEAPENVRITSPFSVAITEETIQNLHTVLRADVTEVQPLANLHTAPLPGYNPTTQVEQIEPNIPSVPKEPPKQYPLSLMSADHKLPQVSVPRQVLASLLDDVSGQIDGDFTQIITQNHALSVTKRSMFDNIKKVAKTKAAREWKIEKKLAKLTNTHADLIDRLIRFPGDFSCRRANSAAKLKRK